MLTPTYETRSFKQELMHSWKCQKLVRKACYPEGALDNLRYSKELEMWPTGWHRRQSCQVYIMSSMYRCWEKICRRPFSCTAVWTTRDQRRCGLRGEANSDKRHRRTGSEDKNDSVGESIVQNHCPKEATWELRDQVQQKYPHLLPEVGNAQLEDQMAKGVEDVRP